MTRNPATLSAIPSHQAARAELLQLLPLGLVVMLGAALRIYRLGAESYWLDEGIMLQVLGGGIEQIVADYVGHSRPPLFVLLAYGWVSLFGASEVAARALPAIFGIGSLLAIYFVGVELFGRRVGLSASLLMALSETQIYHAQNFRYYSLVVFLTLMSFLFYLRMLRTASLVAVVAWAVATLLLFYTHFLTLLVFPAQALHFLLLHRRYRSLWRPWLATQATLATAVVAQLAMQLYQKRVVQAAEGEPLLGPGWIPPAELAAISVTLRNYLMTAAPPREAALIASSTLLAGLLGFWLVRRRSGLHKAGPRVAAQLRKLAGRWPQLMLVVFWLVFPIGALFVLSLLVRPMYLDRYTLSASPALYLLIACGLWAARPALPMALALGAFVILAAPGLQLFYLRDNNEQWREAAAYVAASEQPGDALLLAPDSKDEAWAWYYRGALPRCSPGAPVFYVDHIAEVATQCSAEHGRVWLLLRDIPLYAEVNDTVTDRLRDGQIPGVELTDVKQFTQLRLLTLQPLPDPEQ